MQFIPGENPQTDERDREKQNAVVFTDYVSILQRQYHSQIDNLIEETVKEMTTLLVAKVALPVNEYSQFMSLCLDVIASSKWFRKVKLDFATDSIVMCIQSSFMSTSLCPPFMHVHILTRI